jgi:hypothetical protein
MLVLAVDPGLRTGIVMLTHEGFLISETVDPFEMGRKVERALASGDVKALVCEAYIITKATLEKSRQNYSLELIGVCKYLCEKYAVEFILQTPGEGLSFVRNDKDEFGKLKRLGWYVTNDKGNHQNAARSHLLLYMVRNKLLDPSRLLEESTSG